MRLFVLSTVGTAVITNTLGRELGGRVLKLGNMTEKKLTGDDRTFLENALGRAKDALSEADRTKAKALSAELNGWLSYDDETREAGGTFNVVQHWLITTDTYTGHRTGELVRDWLISNGDNAEIFRAEGLRTDDAAFFRAALAHVMKDLWETIEGYKAAGYHVVFNLTGGFKGVTAFFQTVATLAEAEIIYIFEGGGALIRIPRLPVRLDEERLAGMGTDTFARLAAGEEIGKAEAQAAGLPDALLYFVDGQAILSEWGRSIWERTWSDRARHQLMPPGDHRVILTNKFSKECERLPPDRLLHVNQAIRAVSDWIASRPRHLKSRTIDKLSAPHPNGVSTHEVYAWSDQNAGRVFFHKAADGRVIIDELGEHL